MEVDEVEARVLDAAAALGLSATFRRAKDGYLEADLAADGDGRTAMLFTNGVEAFHLRLDGRYDLRDFDHELSGQGEVIDTLVGVASAHLRGESVPSQEARRLRGALDCLDVPWQGHTYRARA